MNPGPGLDLTQLRRLRNRTRDHHARIERIAAHLDTHRGYVALSGGKDSAVVAHLARQADPNVHICWFDSGLEWPETREHLARLQDLWNLNLHVIRPTPNALEVLIASGHWHTNRPAAPVPSLSDVCINAPARTAHDHYGPGVLWGVRADESTRRRAHYATSLTAETDRSCRGCCRNSSERANRHGGTAHRRDGTISYGPIWNWTTDDVLSHHATHDIPLNPVYRKLARLGATPEELRVSHIIDGTRLHHGSAVRLKAGWPTLWADLTDQLPLLASYA